MEAIPDAPWIGAYYDQYRNAYYGVYESEEDEEEAEDDERND